MVKTPYLSLFAGVGGLDLGLRIAVPSAQCIGNVEVNVEAAEILAARIEEGSLDDAPVWSDIRSFPGELYRGRVAGIVAGFPCPDYSVAGKRAGVVGKHGQLWDHLAECIRNVGPDWVLLENVSGIIIPHGADDGTVLPAGLWFVLGNLASLGFDAEWICLRASDVGASHGRMRWFCLAYRQGRGCGELRQPSGGDGLADRRGEALEHAARHGQPGRIGKDRRSGRRGVLKAGEQLGHTDQPGLEGRGEPRQPRGARRQRPGVTTGPELADTRRATVWQSGERQHNPMGREQHADLLRRELADTERAERRPHIEHNQPEGRRIEEADRSRSAGAELADTTIGNEGEPCGDTAGSGRRIINDGDREQSPGVIGGDLPIFAPGPGEANFWRDLLVRCPWLRPAISQAEAELFIRGMAPGSAAGLDLEDRTDRLRSLGNLVCPMQAAVALTALVERAGITL